MNGEFTQTERSQTVIDYVMTGTNTTTAVLDFEFKEIGKSDHQPCTVSLYMEGATTHHNNPTKVEVVEKIKWIPQNAAIFKDTLESISVPNTSSAEMYEGG